MKERTSHYLEQKLIEKVQQLSISMEKMKLAEYVELLSKPKRLLWINFIAGIARGFGTAIGFTILGALVIILLRDLNVLRLPVIGGFIAEIVRIVQENLRVR